MIVSIHHIQICAPRGCDDAARKFYGELLGLREIEKPQHLEMWHSPLNLRDSHDTARFLSIAKGDKRALKLAWLAM